MPTTRSSARRTDGSSPAPSTSTTGSKRKATDASPSSAPKKGRRGAPKKQKTIEDTMPKPKDTGMLTDEDEAEAEAEETEVAAPQDPVNGESKEVKPPKEDLSKENADGLGDKETVGESSSKPEASKEETQSEDVEPKKPATEGNAVEKSAEREESTPSSILEKGIIYFFFRGRVGIDEPSAVDEIARSYIVLRPIPHGAKIGDGPMGDDGNARVLALPKKVLPVSPNDRFMVFVNKARSTIEDIKKDFLSASDYETKTAGTRHTPPATPIGEGIYAITTTGKESHLAYILTLPTEISEVQKDIGLQERGSFVTSVKNPQYESPANAQLPDGPKFPQDILDEFRSLRWMPLQAKHLDYENAQFLIIGHKDDALAKGVAPQKEDQEQNKDEPKEEMEKLEHEDEIRVKHLEGNDAVYEDLNVSAKDYPKLQTTW